MTDAPTAGLKDALARRKQMLQDVQTQGEMDTLPQSRQEAALVQMQSTLSKMLPQTMSPEKAMKLVNNTIQLIRQTPKLALCGNTVMGGVLTAAQLGLELGVNALGEAYLLPFKRNKKINGQWVEEWEATLIIGYKGYRKLSWQSGTIKSISRHIVYANDYFDFEYGSEERLRHKPAEGERGPVIGYYATVSNIMGGTMWTYMTLAEMENHRDNYAMAKKVDYKTKEVTIVGPWRDNFHEMALKTVLLKTLRDSPLSVEDKMLTATHVDGSVRRNTDELTDHGDIVNASILPETFTANGVNVIDGDYEEEPPAEEPPAEEPTPQPARGKKKLVPATEEQKAVIREHIDARGESDYDLYLQSFLGAVGVELEKLTEGQAADVITRLANQEK